MASTGAIIGVSFLVFVIAAVSTPVGVGGGLLFTPLLQLILGFTQQQAVALSQILVAGASISSLLYQIYQQIRHPNEPLLINAYFVRLLLPAILAGATLGVFLSRVAPLILQPLVLVLLCMYSAVKIFKKGIAEYRKETRLRENESYRATGPSVIASVSMAPDRTPDRTVLDQTSVISSPLSVESPELLIDEQPSPSLISHQLTPAPEPIGRPALQSYQIRITEKLQDELGGVQPAGHTQSTIFHMQKDTFYLVAYVLMLFVIYVLFLLLRGSSTHQSITGAPYCGVFYWTLYCGQFLLFVSIALFIDIKEYKTIGYVVIGGALAALSGVGGGIIISPVLLSRQLTPQQTAATSIVMVTCLSTAASIDYLLAGVVEYWLAALATVTFLGGLVGSTVIAALVKWSGRSSLIVLILGCLVVIGALLTLIVGIKNSIQRAQTGQSPFAVHSPCS